MLGLKASLSITTLPLRSTWNQRGKLIPLLSPYQHRFLQLVAFRLHMYPHVHSPARRRNYMSYRYYDLQAEVQITLHHFILTMLQVLISVRPFIRMFTRLVDAVIQGIMLSAMTLITHPEPARHCILSITTVFFCTYRLIFAFLSFTVRPVCQPGLRCNCTFRIC
jgi:hypothetical protein